MQLKKRVLLPPSQTASTASETLSFKKIKIKICLWSVLTSFFKRNEGGERKAREERKSPTPFLPLPPPTPAPVESTLESWGQPLPGLEPQSSLPFSFPKKKSVEAKSSSMKNLDQSSDS